MVKGIAKLILKLLPKRKHEPTLIEPELYPPRYMNETVQDYYERVPLQFRPTAETPKLNYLGKPYR